MPQLAGALSMCCYRVAHCVLCLLKLIGAADSLCTLFSIDNFGCMKTAKSFHRPVKRAVNRID